MKRTATAVWKGSGKDGKGHVSTQSTVLKEQQYSYSSRFEHGIGTNPEELVAAAHSGCFAMKLSFNLTDAGFVPDELNAKCTITLQEGAITSSHIDLNAKVPGMGSEQFEEALSDAKANCPISKLLNTEITVSYTLNA